MIPEPFAVDPFYGKGLIGTTRALNAQQCAKWPQVPDKLRVPFIASSTVTVNAYKPIDLSAASDCVGEYVLLGGVRVSERSLAQSAWHIVVGRRLFRHSNVLFVYRSVHLCHISESRSKVMRNSTCLLSPVTRRVPCVAVAGTNSVLYRFSSCLRSKYAGNPVEIPLANRPLYCQIDKL